MSGILLIPLGAGTPPALHFKRAAFSYGVRGACGALRPPSGQQNGPSGGLQAGAAIPSRTIIGGKASGVGQVPEEPEVPCGLKERARCTLEDGPIAEQPERSCSATRPHRTGSAGLTLMPIKHLNVKRLLEAVRAVTWQTYVLPARDKTPAATSMIVPPTIDSGRVSKDDPRRRQWGEATQ